MDSAPANDWTARDLPELVAFFAWMDVLCSEAKRQGHKSVWPIPEDLGEALNYWISYFGRGLTPLEALDNVHSSQTAEARI